jgi:tetratricopeptide (TPR) repeat protein
METLHISLKWLNDKQVDLRYWRDKPSAYEQKTLAIAEIGDLIGQSELNYYVLRPNLVSMGQRLFNWLDGEGRWLSRAIQDCAAEGLVLAIAPDAKLAHLPWEIMHDGTEFLVQKPYPLVMPLRWLDQPFQARQPQERPLQVLFMAASPENVEPVLRFEEEEAAILSITKDLPLTLRVEESGCVEELQKLWRRYPEDTFDVFHLTGHADHQRTPPYAPFFITESLTGDRKDITAENLLQVFQVRRPRLIFLSGCRTGEAVQKGSVPSFAETLVQRGMPAVLGWGRPVLDTTATQAGAFLYEQLAAGCQLVQALSLTYQNLIKTEVKGWHLLRLYVRGEAWGAVVNPPGFYQPRNEPVQYQFLDREQQIRVAPPEDFIGRRRILQGGLRTLREAGKIGIFFHGMGGVGKSTVAARLLERLPEYQPIVIYQGLDAAKLERLLNQQCTSSVGLGILNSELPFMQRLTDFLDRGLNDTQQPFIFVLDDFEANLEARSDGEQVLKAEVVEILNDLLQAVMRSKVAHRILITSRYDVRLPELNERVERVTLSSLRGADLQKKCDRLTAFQAQSTVDASLQAQAKALADGNPRLLEWLDRVLRDGATEPQVILDAMAGRAKEFRESILAEILLKQQSTELKDLLSRMQVFELPVPKSAITAIVAGMNALEATLQRAIALGLVECNRSGGETMYRLPRILMPLLETIQDPALYQLGLNELYRLWWSKETQRNEERAIELYRLAELAQSDEICTEIGEALALRWNTQGRFRDAILKMENVLEMRRKLLGIEHPDVATSLNNLAVLYYSQGRYSEAEPLYQQALEIRRKLLGTEHPDVAQSLHDLAYLYSSQGRYSEAEPLYQQALEMRHKLLGTEHPEVAVAQSLHNLEYLYYSQGRYSEAEPLYQQALEMRRKPLGTEHPEVAVAQSLHNLAYLFYSQGRYSEAEPLYQQALEMRRKLLGTEHPEVAQSLHNLAELYESEGRYLEAEPLYQQALEMRRKLSGTEHPGVAMHLNGLAGLFFSQGRYSEAEPLYQQALEMRRKLLGTEHPSVATSLNDMAGLFYRQGRYSEAEPLYQQALEMRRKLLGAENPSVATSLNNLGLLFYSQGRYSEAEPLYQQALEMRRKLLGTEHPEIAQSLHNLGSLYQRQGKYPEAKAHYCQALAIAHAKLGPYHPDTINMQDWLDSLPESSEP